MGEKLTNEHLEKYLEKNANYYEKYRETFNELGYVLSWNWSLFFFTPWLAYRKLWGYYIGYFLANTLTVLIFYKLMTNPRHLPTILSYASGLVLFTFVLFAQTTVNTQILRNASSADATENGKSSKLVVFIATLGLIIPQLITAITLM